MSEQRIPPRVMLQALRAIRKCARDGVRMRAREYESLTAALDAIEDALTAAEIRDAERKAAVDG